MQHTYCRHQPAIYRCAVSVSGLFEQTTVCWVMPCHVLGKGMLSCYIVSITRRARLAAALLTTGAECKLGVYFGSGGGGSSWVSSNWWKSPGTNSLRLIADEAKIVIYAWRHGNNVEVLAWRSPVWLDLDRSRVHVSVDVPLFLQLWAQHAAVWCGASCVVGCYWLVCCCLTTNMPCESTGIAGTTH